MKLVVFLGLVAGVAVRLSESAAGQEANRLKTELGATPVKVNKCTKDSIQVTLTTIAEFSGVVFTLDKDGSDKTCEFTSRPGDGLTLRMDNAHHETDVTFAEPDCSIRRAHVKDPDCTETGTETKEEQCLVDAYAITVYIRFWLPEEHENGELLPGVHTKVDEAYTIACVPQSDNQEYSAELTVVDIEPNVLIKDFTATPDCTYCISLFSPVGSPDSPDPNFCFDYDVDDDETYQVPFERKVYHEFHCEPNSHWEGAYCLQIVSLYASYMDGIAFSDLSVKNSVKIIENDCTTDDKLIGNIKYDGNTWGFGTSHPFHVGHPEDGNDGVDVHFYAQIAYYPTEKDETCIRPDCPDGKRRKRFALNSANATNTFFLKKSLRMDHGFGYGRISMVL